MTSKELNLNLIESFPEIKDAYLKETSWQEGDKTGSHVIYADVLVPFIKKQIKSQNETMLRRISEFIEALLKTNDEYANEVLILSVLESLLFDEDTNNEFFLQFAKVNTLKAITELLQDF